MLKLTTMTNMIKRWWQVRWPVYYAHCYWSRGSGVPGYVYSLNIKNVRWKISDKDNFMKTRFFLHLFEFRLIDDALDNSQWSPAHIFGATFAVIANIKCRNNINCDLKYQNNISHNNTITLTVILNLMITFHTALAMMQKYCKEKSPWIPFHDFNHGITAVIIFPGSKLSKSPPSLSPTAPTAPSYLTLQCQLKVGASWCRQSELPVEEHTGD